MCKWREQCHHQYSQHVVSIPVGRKNRTENARAEGKRTVICSPPAPRVAVGGCCARGTAAISRRSFQMLYPNIRASGLKREASISASKKEKSIERSKRTGREKNRLFCREIKHANVHVRMVGITLAIANRALAQRRSKKRPSTQQKKIAVQDI